MSNIETLLQIMSDLRDPETGCPWDKKQNFETIIPYTLEEAYEVQDAILDNDMDALCDELGDLLLQVVYHAQMAKELGHFSFDDVVKSICDKMIRRHPHVFGEENFQSDEEVKGSWEKIKQQERVDKNKSSEPESLLDGVLKTLPALKQAQKIQKKAAAVGFDWVEMQSVFDKIKEECNELQYEIDQAADKAKLSDEIGDVFFSVVNLARRLKLDAEISLQKTNKKFTQRFQYIEAELRKRDQKVEETELEILDALWEQAKIDLKN